MTQSPLPCVSCGTANPADHNFCAFCGTALRTQTCQFCGALNALGNQFCHHCGFALNCSGGQSLVGYQDERKFVTAFFADIKGSVEMMSRHDIEDARHVIDSVIIYISSIIRKHQGTVVDTVGDGVFAIFGAPQSFDGHPRAAVNAALELQEQMRSVHSEDSPFADIQLRVGIHTGEVIWRALQVGLERRHLPVGQSVNQASRLQTLAEPGSVLIGDSTHDLVRDYFAFESVPGLKLKGIPGAVTAYKVLKPSDISRNLQISIKRGLSPLVGRDHELQVLATCIQGLSSAKGNALILVSEAGGGKSRLLHEATKLIPAKYNVIEAFCRSHLQSSPWYSVVQLVRRLFDLSPGTPVEASKDHLREKLIALDASLEKEAPTLFQLLDLEVRPSALVDIDPITQRGKFVALMLRLFVLSAKISPLVIVIEDLHWLDSQSADVVDRLLISAADHSILLLCTSRPEGIREAWRTQSASILEFGNLDESSARALITSLVSTQEISESILQKIQSKTEGNPFFIEELIRSLRSNTSSFSAATERLIDNTLMPSTIQMVISERIDRLPPRSKQYLQMLAVVGNQCRLDLFSKLLAETPENVHPLLGVLEQLGFISKLELDNYKVLQFVHVLIQEVAYSSLLSDSRASLHEHIADTMKAEGDELIQELLPELAHHYQNSSNDQKAVEYLRLAGESAIQRSAHQEAQNYLKLGLERLEKSRQIADRLTPLSHLWLSLGVSLQITLGYAAEEVKTAYENAVSFSEQAGNSDCLLAALRGYAVFTGVRANYLEAEHIATRLKKLSKGNRAFELEHLILHGLSFSYRGQLEKGAKYYKKAIALKVNPVRLTSIQYSGYSRSICYSYYALNALFAGRLRLARSLALKGLDVAIASGIPIAVAQSRGMYANVCFSMCEFTVAEEQLRLNLAYADENGFSYWSLLGRLLIAWSRGCLGNEVASLEEFNAYLSAYKASGALIGMTWFLNLYAELLWHFERPQEALHVLSEAEDIAAMTGERFFLVDTLRLKGEFLAANAEKAIRDEALRSFWQAIHLAHGQGTWLLAMRAAVRLARLLQQRECGEQARAVLAYHYKKVSWLKGAIHQEVWEAMLALSIDRPFLARFSAPSFPLLPLDELPLR